MPSPSDKAAHPSLSGQAQRYFTAAEEAIRQYPLGPATLTFVQQNAGAVFRVEIQKSGQVYLLKIHDRAGAGANPTVEQLEAGLHWLAALARDTDIVVQTPVVATTGQFVSQVALADSPPVNCTVQQWVAGEPPHGHFTADQVRRIGALMATLHKHSTGYPLPPHVTALRQDAADLARNVGILRAALDTALLSDREYAVLVAAQKHITALMASLGTAPELWGPVHGDLHHDNLLFFQQEIRPIDFTGLRLAHYAYDIGVTLYHIYYQAPAIRHAFFDGYQQVRLLTKTYPREVEAFMTHAAIDNIAWNSTLPAQVHSALFQRNLRQLIATFCTNLAAGHPFLFS